MIANLMNVFRNFLDALAEPFVVPDDGIEDGYMFATNPHPN